MSGGRKPGRQTVEKYTTLPYHLLVVRDDEDKGKPWTASVEELVGCTTHGRTPEEALSGIQSAMASWIAVALEEGREIPEPRSAASHSGRLLLRMPRTLHADLTRASEREAVSLNQFITDVLAAAVVWRGGPHVPRPATPINQAPGAEGLTAEPGARRRAKRNPTQLTNVVLAANFVIVAVAGTVAIIVLIASAQ